MGLLDVIGVVIEARERGDIEIEGVNCFPKDYDENKLVNY